MRTNEKGAANRQANRSHRHPALSRKPRPSVAELQDGEEWGLLETVGIVAFGSCFLLSFMWLAAAY